MTDNNIKWFSCFIFKTRFRVRKSLVVVYRYVAYFSVDLNKIFYNSVWWCGMSWQFKEVRPTKKCTTEGATLKGIMVVLTGPQLVLIRTNCSKTARLALPTICLLVAPCKPSLSHMLPPGATCNDVKKSGALQKPGPRPLGLSAFKTVS